jgi:hypothetical protein
VPKERVELLRAAFMKTMTDPDYLAEVKIQKAEHSPKDGAAVQAVVNDLAKAPPAVVQRYLKALGGKPPSGG